MKTNKVIVALDSNNIRKTISLVSILKNEVFAFKLGYEFFYNYGVEGYKKIYKISPKIFLDLKLHDIPNTVQNGMIAINKMKPLLTTIHISGGEDMMSASFIKRKFTKILGVTVLTSIDNNQVRKLYNEKNIENVVKKFAKLAKKNKLDGIVCSPKEIKIVRKIVGKNFLIVTPGIRLNNFEIKRDDQKRVTSPKKALELGADLIVIGRPITEAKKPLDEIRKINILLG
tara:strand:+ start:367 stop:1053 length:687 start_codon:yes stop_codon:yes gene_type:complete